MIKPATSVASIGSTPANLNKSFSDVARIARQPVWKVEEAALVLRCDERAIRRELNRGTITGVRVGNRWRIPANQFSPSPKNDHLRPLYDPFAAIRSIAPNDQHRLKLYLFGRPQIYVDEVRIIFVERSNRRSQVIQLLALYRAGLSGPQLGNSLSMAGHLYEDESLDPHYVRTLVWGVRAQAKKTVGWEGIIESPAKCGAGLHYYKLPENTTCDLWEFEDMLDEADQLSLRATLLRPDETVDEATVSARASAIERAAALREQALQLYRGDFCEGSNNSCVAQAGRLLEERYTHAALQQGSYWRAKALTAMALKDQEAKVARDGPNSALATCDTRLPIYPAHLDLQTIWQEAIRNYERVLRVDNYHEAAYIHMMECNAFLGNTSGVDQIFNRCQDVLHADLLQAPTEDIVAAYKECKKLLGIGRIAARGLEEELIFSR